MSRDEALRRLANEAAQARADVDYLFKRARSNANAALENAHRTAGSDLSGGRRRARETYRKRLENIREGVHGLTRAAGPSLLPWQSIDWEALDHEATDQTTVARTAIRLGEIILFASDTSEDTLLIPATVVPEQTGAVIVTASAATIETVRSAFLGWCLRLLAVAGPGKVSIVWLDKTREGAQVPCAWRPAVGASTVLETYHQEALERAGAVPKAGTATDTESSAIRTVLVAIGADADRVPELGARLALHAPAGASRGVHVFAAPTKTQVKAAQAVLVLDAAGAHGRVQAPGAALGKHAIVLQHAPPKEVVERLAGWSVPFTAIAEQPATSSRDAPNGLGADGVSADQEQDDVRRTVPTKPADVAVLEEDATATTGVPSKPTPQSPSSAPQPGRASARETVAGAAYLRQLLAAPAPPVPQLTLALDDHGEGVRVPCDHSLLVTGGDLVAGAALMASFLVELACQAPTAALEFAVLDVSDEPSVADRFDAVVDHVPHLVDYSQGVGVILALDEIAARMDRRAVRSAALSVLVIGSEDPPEHLMTALQGVLRANAAARVTGCVWVPSHSLEVLDGPHVTLLSIEQDRASLRIGAGSTMTVKPPHPMALDDVEAVADMLRRVRR